MERLAEILEYGSFPASEPVGDQHKTGYKRAIFKALVNCLTPEEVCKCVGMFHAMATGKRYVIIDRMQADIRSEVRPCHYELIDAEIDRYRSLAPRQLQSAEYLLSLLCNVATPRQRKTLTNLFLNAKIPRSRFRAYQILSRNWDGSYKDAIELCWNRHRDAHCAALILMHFSDAFITDHASELYSSVAGHKGLLTDYRIRIAQIDPALLGDLAGSDPPTYIYVCARAKQHVSASDAWQMYECYKAAPKSLYTPDLVGLFIWSFGQLGLWDLILRVHGEVANGGVSEWIWDVGRRAINARPLNEHVGDVPRTRSHLSEDDDPSGGR